MASLFISYAHRDEQYRQELEKHLTMLRRQEVIDVWHDRRIGPGEEIDAEISRHLESASIVLLLISVDFLASTYCYDKEMLRALERHSQGRTRVIPVILRPCDWHSAPFAHLKAVPTDGKPLLQYATLDEGFLEVAQAVRGAATLEPQQAQVRRVVNRGNPEGSASSYSTDRSSNLRIKRTFTDHERDEFLGSAFEYVAHYFDNSLAELKMRNRGVEVGFSRIDAMKFEAIVYVGGQEKSRCKIWLGGTWSTNQIYYSTVQFGDGYNESLSIADDGYILYVSPMGMPMFGQQSDQKLTHEGAAEYLWSLFVRALR